VTAADIHTLTDVYRHIALRTAAGIKVYFHFDYEDENIRIESVRREAAKVTITANVRDNILIRLPRWTPADSVKLTIAGQPVALVKIGDFALLARDRLPGAIVLTYALPITINRESAGGTDYEFLWRGDEVLGVRPNDFILPFYPTYVPESRQ